jgi:hypothetical protein
MSAEIEQKKISLEIFAQSAKVLRKFDDCLPLMN